MRPTSALTEIAPLVTLEEAVQTNVVARTVHSDGSGGNFGPGFADPGISTQLRLSFGIGPTFLRQSLSMCTQLSLKARAMSSARQGADATDAAHGDPALSAAWRPGSGDALANHLRCDGGSGVLVGYCV